MDLGLLTPHPSPQAQAFYPLQHVAAKAYSDS
jgi:hypothetical protein